jgi:diadenosine tetraphosphate (Ap4A) HIT family hydrolase
MNWEDLAAGRGCFFDQPRPASTPYWDAVTRMGVSTLCLQKNQIYHGHCILIFDSRHAIRPDELTLEEWTAFTADLHRAVGAIMRVCTPDHINVVCQGNVVPHLHWHIVPRYKTDPRWGAPITMTTMEEMHRMLLLDHERTDLIERLRAALPVLETR